ncbi:MAG: hypothetical protein HQK50_09795 [Oligoflexia bacterium]|nr:hypothetical protein [Oligoflexia bacterium]MBF0365855.1 hypothetical protein [Oligoflexia bacterium]
MDFDRDKKQVLHTILLIASVAVGTTFVYFKINPRPDFKTTMLQAGQMALAGNLRPTQVTPSPAQGQQVMGVQQQQLQLPQTNQVQGQFIAGGQYVCSQCGHTALPNFDQNGTPHCSECGGLMNINRLDANEAVQICANNNCPTLK